MSNKSDETEKKFGGRVLIRMPGSLHRELANAASDDGVSLNQFICALLASGVGWRHSAADRGGAGDRGVAGEGATPETGWDQHNSLVSTKQYREIFNKNFG